MKPIEQTIQAVAHVSRFVGEDDLLAALQTVGDQVQELVPDCTGLSIAWQEHGVTFTLVASDEEIAVLDAIQHYDGGPRADAVTSGPDHPTGADEPLDEDQWRRFGEATAVPGVRSTVTFPLVEGEGIIGSVNLYGASRNAFEGQHDELAGLLGAWAPGAVRNADLSFDTRRLAEQAPETLRAQDVISRAVGMIVVHQDIDISTAHELLHATAHRVGIRPEQLAEALIQLG
ncbi:MAG: response regulator receiver [Marmoricola sp.]|nr:response regulator receiver [Marmoricola sp.]